MLYKILINTLFLSLTYSATGQLSIKNPQICHDKNNYLKCYNDGVFLLKFENGYFKDFVTSDSIVTYSDADKLFTFYRKSTLTKGLIDTIRFKLLPKSVLVQQRQSVFEVKSFTQLPPGITQFGISLSYSGEKVNGFNFYDGYRYFSIRIWTYNKVWSWDISVNMGNEELGLAYNGYRNNKLEYIFIENDSLRYGVSFSAIARKIKQFRRVESSYLDTLGTTSRGYPIIGRIELDKYYYYSYNKKGRLNIKKMDGELKLCQCD
jgi:hypothetical protein